jgi:hypothetical protein
MTRPISHHESGSVHLRRVGQVFGTAILSLGLIGCQSFNSPPSTNLASVKIQNQPGQVIQQATIAVFRDHYFTLMTDSPGQLVFTRPGSKWDNIAYGDFMDEKTTIRVKVAITPLDSSTTLLACNAQIVSNAGDDVLEDDHKVPGYQKGPYQDLLNEVQARLK